MKLQLLIKSIGRLLSVPKCVCCGVRLDMDSEVFCTKCAREYTEAKSRNCSRCAKLLSECSCSIPYLETHFVKTLIKVFRYKRYDDYIPPQNALIFSLKRDNRSDVLEFCASELEYSIRESLGDPSDFIFTNVPRRKSAIIKYGIDHAAILAKELARRTGAEYVSILKSRTKRAQKNVLYEERYDNVDFDISREIDLTGKSVIIVDDIVTTGASIGRSAMLIRGLGAKRIVGATIAMAYKRRD